MESVGVLMIALLSQGAALSHADNHCISHGMAECCVIAWPHVPVIECYDDI
jgi:hypothetical protein